MLPALYIMNQSKRERESTKNLTSRKTYNINIIFYLRSSAAPNSYRFITQTINII